MLIKEKKIMIEIGGIVGDGIVEKIKVIIGEVIGEVEGEII